MITINPISWISWVPVPLREFPYSHSDCCADCPISFPSADYAAAWASWTSQSRSQAVLCARVQTGWPSEVPSFPGSWRWFPRSALDPLPQPLRPAVFPALHAESASNSALPEGRWGLRPLRSSSPARWANFRWFWKSKGLSVRAS